MKKFFLFAAALVAAVSVNAEVYYFDNQASTYVLSDQYAEAMTYALDGVDGFAVKYTGASASDEKMTVALAANEDVFFEYGNSSSKDKIIVTAPNFLVMNGKGIVINVKNLMANDEVYVLYSAKGSTAAVMTNADNANTIVMEDAVTTNAEKGDKDGLNADKTYVLTLMHVKADAKGGIKIKETDGGARIFAIGINEVPALATALENVEAVKTVKTIENGQLVIIRNGVKYNANGMAL